MQKTIQIEEFIGDPRLDRLRTGVIAFCFLVLFFDGYDTNLLGYVGPALIKHLGITKAAFGPVVSAGLAGFMLGALVLGELGDRFGRKRLIVAGTAIFGVLTLTCAWADSVTVFVVLRFLAGIGLGGAIPNAIALNAEFAPKKSMATVIGLMFVGYTLGGGAPGWVAAVWLGDYGWQIVFYVGAILPLILSVVLFFFLPESIRYLAAHDRQDDLRQLVRRADVASGETYEDRVFVSGDAPASGVPTRQLFVGGRAPVTLLVWLAFVSCLSGIVFVVAWAPAIFADLGFSHDQAALICSMWQVGGAVGSLVIPRLLDRFGRLAVALSIVLAMPFVMSAGFAGHSQALLMVIILIGGFFALGGQVGLNAVAGTVYPTAIRATGVGWAFGIGRIGAILGPLAGGMLIAQALSPQSLLIVMALPFGVAALAVVLLYFRSVPVDGAS